MNLGIQFYSYSEGESCGIFCVSLAVRPFEQDNIGFGGAPDWVVEILSPWTHRHDRFTKFNLHQKAGVREYWIVDPDNKCVQVFVLTDSYYKAADFGEVGDKLSVNVLDDCVIDLSRVFSE